MSDVKSDSLQKFPEDPCVSHLDRWRTRWETRKELAEICEICPPRRVTPSLVAVGNPSTGQALVVLAPPKRIAQFQFPLQIYWHRPKSKLSASIHPKWSRHSSPHSPPPPGRRSAQMGSLWTPESFHRTARQKRLEPPLTTVLDRRAIGGLVKLLINQWLSFSL